MKFKSQSLLLLKLDFLAFFSILYRVTSVGLFLALFVNLNLNLIYCVEVSQDVLYSFFSEFLHLVFYFIVIFHIFFGRLKYLLTVDKILIFVSNNITNITRLYSIIFTIILIFSFIMVNLNFVYVNSIILNLQKLIFLDCSKIFDVSFLYFFAKNFINNIGLYNIYFILFYFVIYLLFFYFKYQIVLFFFKKDVLSFFEKIHVLYFSWLPLKKMLVEKYTEIYKNKNFYIVYMWQDSTFEKILLKRSLFAKWFQNDNINIADHNFKDPLYIVVLDSYIYFLQRCCSIYFLYIEQELFKKI